MRAGKTLDDFEKQHGGSRIAELERAMAAASGRNATVTELPCAQNVIRFGVISDTHYGSLYEASDCVKVIYDHFASEGIKNVLHAGDVLTGHHVYPGHEFEVRDLGFRAQLEHFQRDAPKHEGMVTHFITGNHDASFKKRVGADVGQSINEKRPDWVCVGEDSANIVFCTPSKRKYVVQLIHPDGGCAYALSYKGQKIAESLDGGSKPHLLVIGHFHKAEMMPAYRNISVVQAGAFEWQTPFLVRKGSPSHVGGWIIEVNVGKQYNTVRSQFVAFYAKAKTRE